MTLLGHAIQEQIDAGRTVTFQGADHGRVVVVSIDRNGKGERWLYDPTLAGNIFGYAHMAKVPVPQDLEDFVMAMPPRAEKDFFQGFCPVYDSSCQPPDKPPLVATAASGDNEPQWNITTSVNTNPTLVVSIWSNPTWEAWSCL